MPEILPGLADITVEQIDRGAIEGFAAKEALVRQFAAENRPRAKKFGLFSDHDYEAKSFQERIAKQNHKTGIVNWLQRLYFVNSLGRAGIQDTQQLVSLLDDNVEIVSYGHIPAKEVVALVKSLSSEDEQAALNKLRTGFQRLKQLNLFPLSYEFKDQVLSKAVVSLINIPDETFQKVYAELDQYKFLYPGYLISYHPSSTQALVKIFEHGGLTEEQRALLEKEELYSDFTGSIPIVEGDGPWRFNSLPKLGEALNPEKNYLNEFYPYFIDYASTRIQSPKQYSKAGEVSYLFLEGLEFLRKEGKLTVLQSLLKSGWNCTTVYEGLEGNYDAPTRERVIEMLEQMSDFSKDTEKSAWIKQFQETVEGGTTLLSGRIDMYEALYKKKDKLDELSAVLRVLPGTNDLSIDEVVNISDGVLRIKYDFLDRRLKESKDKQFAYTIETILNHMPGQPNPYGNRPIKEEYMPLLAYVSLHKDQLGKLDPTDFRVNAQVVAGVLTAGILPDDEMLQSFVKLCIDPENLPPKLAWQYLPLYTVSEIEKILNKLPDAFIDTLPVADQQVINFAKSLNGIIARPGDTQSFLLFHKDKVSGLLIDGKPAVGLFELLASDNPGDEAIDVLLSDEVMNSFTEGEKQFWQVLKSFPIGEGIREVLFKNRDKFGQFIVNGQPTAAFINQFAPDARDYYVKAGGINRLLDRAAIDGFPKRDQEFWSFYQAHFVDMRVFLLGARGNFSAMVIDGKATPGFLDEAASKNNPDIARQVFQTIDWVSYPQQKPFWEYYVECPTQFKSFIYSHKDRFVEFVADGVETVAFYQALASEDPRLFVRLAQKEQWRATFGEELINKLLDTLPKQTDEKRNAFTHNEYDRTTEFISYLVSISRTNFILNDQDIGILTEYIRQFGFSKTPTLFHFFKNLSLLEQHKIGQLPQDIEESGIRSITEMVDQLKRVKEMVYSENPMTDLANFSPFEIEMLRFITGKSTHRWDSGKPAIEQIIRDFQAGLAAGEIQGLLHGYHTENLNASNVRIEFNEEAIREDYEILKNEILESIQNPNDVAGLKEIVANTLSRKIAEIQRNISESEGKRLEFMMREVARFEEYGNRLTSINDLGSLIVNLLEMNFDKTEQRVINSVFRRIILGKVFQKHFSPGFIEEMQRQLEGEISAGSIESILNIVDEMVKTHALNLEGDNKEGYWGKEAFAKIKGLKRGRDLPHSFSPHIGKLREEVEKFQKIQTGGSNTVRVIPDRGFVGEMSGYLADVCYTAEYPLLKRYPKLTPFKFVTNNPDTGEPQFIGSVLVFELNDVGGQPLMLVRAFDIPHENEIDINSFIEQFLDKLASVGKQRGIKQIIVPGDSGAISNYQMTINHMRQNYIVGKAPVSLSERFAFNNYDLTNNCYVARIIE